MGNTYVKQISFEDMQYAEKNKYVIINTIEQHNQKCTIQGTLGIKEETKHINHLIENSKLDTIIIIYGKNSNDNTIYKKYKQLSKLGFTQLYIYTGGLFEWLIMQDIYGDTYFKTTSKELDILKYKPLNIFNIKYLVNE